MIVRMIDLPNPRLALVGAWLPRLASMKIAVVCVFLLLVLTAWGTIYQAEHGLYAAQVRFFNSWFFLAGGFVPLPGAQAVLWVLFINQVASMLFRVKYSLANIGNIVTHSGILVLLAGSFVTFHYAVESYLPLKEKEMSNVSLDRRNWELAVWPNPEEGMEKRISASAIGSGQAGKEIDFSELGLKVVVRAYFKNCVPAEEGAKEGEPGSPGHGMKDGATKLVPRRPSSDPEENVAGAILNLVPAGGEAKEVSLFGAFEEPASVEVAGGRKVMVALRKKRHPLPFTLKLLDVKKEDYPGTGIPRNYQSEVEVLGQGMDRKARIFMNNPLRDKGYTFFQSSYFADQRGRETSVFAVVENKGRLIPYIASAMIFGGMLIHFSIMLFVFGKRRGKETP